MTVHKDLKRIIREHQRKTGESYTTARGHVMRDRAALGSAEHDALATREPVRVDAVVLSVSWHLRGVSALWRVNVAN